MKYPNLTGSLSTYYEGQILGDIFGYETIGIAKTDEEMEAHLASLPNGGQNALGSKWAAGKTVEYPLVTTVSPKLNSA